MQIGKPPESTIQARPWIAQIRAAVGIEQAFDSLLGSLQHHNVRLARFPRIGDAKNFTRRVRSPGAFFHFLGRHSWAARSGHHYWPAYSPAVNDRAARDTDRRDVEADSNSHPQVDLEKNLANPQTLRPLNPTLPRCHSNSLRSSGNITYALKRNSCSWSGVFVYPAIALSRFGSRCPRAIPSSAFQPPEDHILHLQLGLRLAWRLYGEYRAPNFD